MLGIVPLNKFWKDFNNNEVIPIIIENFFYICYQNAKQATIKGNVSL